MIKSALYPNKNGVVCNIMRHSHNYCIGLYGEFLRGLIGMNMVVWVV